MGSQQTMTSAEFRRLHELNKISGNGNEIKNLETIKGTNSQQITASEYIKLDKTPCKYKARITYILNKLGVKYEKELVFLENRKFRFDWAIYINEHKIAVEYEGIYSNKSGHTTMSGYSKDVKKYNLAVMNGWKLLRYTAGNVDELENDLKTWI